MKKRNYKVSLEVLAIVVAVAFIIWMSSSLQENILYYSNLISDFFSAHKILGFFIFLAVSAFSAIISPFSSLPLIPAMVTVWGYFFTFWLLMAGWFFGAWLGYYVGAWTGRKIIARWWDLDKIEYYKEKLSSRAQFWLVVLFRAAIPSEVTGITLGILRYNLVKYLVAVFLTELPFAFVSVYLGGTVAKGNFLAFTLVVILAAGMVALASYLFHKKI